jgi:Cu-processing system permease protein
MIGRRRQVWLCAEHDLVLAVRSRWLQTFAVIFAALVLLVALSGYVLSGGRGIQDFARTASSLVELVVFIIPLTAITFGVTQLTPDAGAAELLYAQPVSRGLVLAGRVGGLWLALASAQAIGFGVAGLVVFASAGSGGVAGFAGVVVTSWVLTAVYVALAAWIAAGATHSKRARVLAIALVVWLASAVLFDAAALGVASTLRSGDASRLLMTSVFLNPVDAARTGALLAVSGTSAFGSASLAFLRFTGGPAAAGALLAVSLIVWILAPLTLAVRRIARADI